jgi:hypothetical protein
MKYNPNWQRDYDVTRELWREMTAYANANWRNDIDGSDGEVNATTLAANIAYAVNHDEWLDEDISHPVYDLAAQIAIDYEEGRLTR